MATPVFVFTNNKGGVGKSTSSTNAAYGVLQTLRHSGVKKPRVLLVDTDSQAHATLLTTGRNNFDEQNSLHTVLMESSSERMQQVIQDVVIRSHWDEGLWVLPGSQRLNDTENQLFSTNGAPYRLAERLKRIQSAFHAIVIDTRPSYTLMTRMAVLAATDAIIPIEPRYLESIALADAIREIVDIREGWQYNNIRISGIVVTKMNRRVKGHTVSLSELEAHPTLGGLVCGVIPANEDITYAHAENISVMQYNPRAVASKAYAELSLQLVKNAYGKGGQNS